MHLSARTRLYQISVDAETTLILDSQVSLAASVVNAANVLADETILDDKGNRLATLATVVLSGDIEFSIRDSGDAWFSLLPTFEPPIPIAAHGGKRVIRFRGSGAIQVHCAFV